MSSDVTNLFPSTPTSETNKIIELQLLENEVTNPFIKNEIITYSRLL